MTMYTESLRAFLKPVLPYLDDESVSEIMINGPEDVWIERKGKLQKTDARFSEEGLLGAARNMAQFVGRQLTDERPRLDARLPDGSRIHVVLPPVARRGTTISIRKFFRDKLTIDALLRFDSLNEPMARILEAAIHTKQNIVVAGGTGSGKTTLLNIVSSLIPDEERILTIEDSAELQLNQSHLVAFESRPPDKFGKGAVDMGELLHSALRLRPDRIVVGEVRGGEAFHLVQAMNTGHGGSLSTTHANTPTDTLRRIESLCLMSSVELPMVAVRAQVASAVKLIVCCERLHDGSRKVTHISEVLPLTDKGDYRTQDLFVFTAVAKDADGNILGYHAPTGIVPTFLSKARAQGFMDLDEAFFDPKTYGVPAPPQFHVGEAVQVRWAPSLKHREKGIPDPEAFTAEWVTFEEKLRAQAKARSSAEPKGLALRPSESARPESVRGEPGRTSDASSRSERESGARAPGGVPRGAAAAVARPASVSRPAPAPMRGAPRGADEDKTPPPTRSPFAPPVPEGRPPPAAAEAKVEIDPGLLEEFEAPTRPVPARRPPSPAGRRPANELLTSEEPIEVDDADKTNIRPYPEKPRR